MPRDKDLKRIIRARMQKTGEAYTTARAHVVAPPADSSDPEASTDPPISTSAPAADTAAADYAAIAGVRDDAVKAKTGRDWREWVGVLDAAGAAQLAHGDIARMLRDQYGVAMWWTQAVTVGYERIRGLRARGQRRTGEWEAGRSRTYGVPVDVLFDAWADDDVRNRWLDEPGARLRTASRPRSLRLAWPDGTTVALWFTAKSDERSTVSVQHLKLADADAVDRWRGFWSARLDDLGRFLTGREL